MLLNVILYYGFMLGCFNDGGWEVVEVDEYGDFSEVSFFWVEVVEDEDDYESYMCLVIFVGMGVEVVDVFLFELNEVLVECCGVEVVQCGFGLVDIMYFGIVFVGSVYWVDDYILKVIVFNVGVIGYEFFYVVFRVLGLLFNQVNLFWILVLGEG